MQGIWKNNLSGYNGKFEKRKKQTTRHLFNDKSKSLGKKVLNGFFHKDFKKEDNYVSLYNIIFDGKEYSKVFGSHFRNVRKDAQRLSHHKTRMIFRNWKQKADFDSEIKTHELSKSISDYIS